MKLIVTVLVCFSPLLFLGASLIYYLIKDFGLPWFSAYDEQFVAFMLPKARCPSDWHRSFISLPVGYISKICGLWHYNDMRNPPHHIRFIIPPWTRLAHLVNMAHHNAIMEQQIKAWKESI